MPLTGPCNFPPYTASNNMDMEATSKAPTQNYAHQDCTCGQHRRTRLGCMLSLPSPQSSPGVYPQSIISCSTPHYSERTHSSHQPSPSLTLRKNYNPPNLPHDMSQNQHRHRHRYDNANRKSKPAASPYIRPDWANAETKIIKRLTVNPLWSPTYLSKFEQKASYDFKTTRAYRTALERYGRGRERKRERNASNAAPARREDFQQRSGDKDGSKMSDAYGDYDACIRACPGRYAQPELKDSRTVERGEEVVFVDFGGFVASEDSKRMEDEMLLAKLLELVNQILYGRNLGLQICRTAGVGEGVHVDVGDEDDEMTEYDGYGDV